MTIRFEELVIILQISGKSVPIFMIIYEKIKRKTHYRLNDFRRGACRFLCFSMSMQLVFSFPFDADIIVVLYVK